MSPGAIDHVWFWTTDMDRALAFYTETLGLRELQRVGDEWAVLDGGTVRLALHGTSEPRAPGGTVVFHVEDLDDERRDLEAKGVTFHPHAGEVPGRARFVSFADPDGNQIQLIEYANRSGRA